MKHPSVEKHPTNQVQSINSMSSYLKEIDRIPLLKREEEEELTSHYGLCCQPLKKENPSHQLCPECEFIKNKLITSNLRFVVSVAKKYQGNNIALSDLINEGNVGLLTAVDKFDHSLGYHFISYAVWWIKQSIMKAISEKSRMIRLPMNRTNELFKIAKYIDEYTKINSKKPTEVEIESHLGIHRQEIKRILDLANGHTSLEELTMHDSNDANTHEIPDHKFTPEQDIMVQSLSHNIEELLQHLPERERFILIHRFGLNDTECLSLSKIGILLGLTKERIRQLEKQSLEHIKQIAKEKQMILYFC